MTTKTKSVRKRLIKSASTNDRRVHITPRITGWAVRKEGNFKASKVVSTQKEAVEIAKSWVTKGDASKVIVHSKDGKFRVAG